MPVFPESFTKGAMPGTTGDCLMTTEEYRRLLKMAGRNARKFQWADVRDMTIAEATAYLAAIQSGMTPGDLQLDALQPDPTVPDAYYSHIYGG